MYVIKYNIILWRLFNYDENLAPGDYCPEKSKKILLDKSPKFTFGVKIQDEKPYVTPGISC